MADLSNSFDVNTTNGTAPEIEDRARAAGMGSIARGFQSGMQSTDLNAMGADEAQMRADGNIVGAEALRQSIGAGQKRQGIYAPDVGRVEDIHGLGDAASWLGGQVGQGTASMMAPVGAATAVGAIGRFGRLIPGATGRAIGAAADLAAPVAAFGINQRQLKGEFYNDAVKDPELMRRTSAKDLNRTADLYGVAAGALDTALPAVIGRQFIGKGIAKGIHGMGVLPKTALELLGEGGTETAQSMGSHYAQGQLNPNRDTSGDFSEDLNSFAGGAAGAGPFALAGSMADAGHRRVGNTAQVLGDKAGQVFDLASGAVNDSGVGPAVQSAAGGAVNTVKGLFGVGKDRVGDVIDLARDDAGNITSDSVKGAASDAVQGAKDAVTGAVQKVAMSHEERQILNQDIPASVDMSDPAAVAQWDSENGPKRTQLVADRLSDLAVHDDVANGILDKIEAAGTNQEALLAATDEGAAHVLKDNDLQQLSDRANKFASAAGEIGMKGAKAAGAGAVTLGKGLAKFGKAMFDSAKESASKKNEQSTSQETSDEFDARMGHAANIGENAAQEALSGTTRTKSSIPSYVKQTVLKMATVAKDFNPKKISPGGTLSLNTMADTLRVGLGGNAAAALTEMQAAAPKETHPLFEYLKQQVETGNTPAGRAARVQMRQQAANELTMLLDPKDASEIMRHEREGSGQMSREKLLDMVDRAADGALPKDGRERLQALFGGPEQFAKAIEVVNGVKPVKEAKNEAALMSSEVDSHETAQAEKKVAKGSGSVIYGFNGTSPRSSADKDPFAPARNVTADARRKASDENIQRAAEGQDTDAGSVEKRPQIVKKDRLNFDGSNSLDGMIAKLETTLKVDRTPQNMVRIMKEEGNDAGAAAVQKHIMAAAAGRESSVALLKAAVDPFFVNRAGDYSVSAMSAAEVMKQAGYEPSKVMSIYRDYLRQEAQQEKTPLAERRDLLAKAKMANAVVLDTMNQKDGTVGGRTTPAERRQARSEAAEFFRERYLAAAEQLSDRDPSKIDVAELMKLGNDGAKSISSTDGDYEARSAKNVITFQSDLFARKADRDLHINANSLVGLVKKNRLVGADGAEASRYAKDRNAQYMSDLSEGIAIVMNSGMVDKTLPTTTNATGGLESFAKGIPPSLRLATTTAGNQQMAKDIKTNGIKTREPLAGPALPFSTPGDGTRGPLPAAKEALRARVSERDATRSDENQNAVSKEQDRDFFVADELSGDLNPKITREPGAMMSPAEAKHYAGLKTTRGKENFKENLSLRDNGEKFSNAEDQKSDNKNASPLDNFDRTNPRDTLTGQVDEFADQRFLSNATGANTQGVGVPENKMDAAPKAAARGDALLNKLKTDFPAGIADLQSRVRSAQRETFNQDRTALVGGAHYVYPAAHALNADRISNLDLGPKEMSQITTARAQVADIVLKAKDISLSHKVALTRMMAPEASADRITSLNYKAVLEKAAAAVNVTAEPAPKAQATAAPEVAAALPKSVLPSGAGRKLNAQSTIAPMMFHGTRAEESALVNANGDLVLKPSKNYQGKTVGVSFTDDVASATDYASRIKGGGPHGFTFKGAKLLKIDTAALKNLTSETFGEYADYTGQPVIIPKGSFSIEAITNPIMSFEDSSLKRYFSDWVEDTYGRGSEAETARSSDNIRNTEREYLEEVAGDDGYEAADRAEAEGILEGAPRNGLTNQNRQDKRDGNSSIASQADMDAATAYLAKVAPSVKVSFEELTGYSGEFINAENAIKISTTAAAGVMQTAYHEAFHKFFADFAQNNPRVQEVLSTLANNPAIMDRVHGMLDGFPAAQRQLQNGEERLAYIYQFHAAGLLDLPSGKGKTLLQKIGAFFRQLLGRVSDSERATELMEAFHRGALAEPSVAGKVITAALERGEMSTRALRKVDGMVQMAAAATLPANEILAKSKSERARLLAKEMFTNPGDHEDGAYGAGYLNARRNTAQKFNNEWAKGIDGLSSRDLADVAKLLQQSKMPNEIAYQPHADAVRKIRAVLERVHEHMVESGVDVGHIDKYYPVTWDTNKLVNDKAAFTDMLLNNYAAMMKKGADSSGDKNLTPADIADRIWRSIIDSRGGDNKLNPSREDGVLVPFFESGEHRVLDWILPEHREPFQEKNLIGQLTRYVHQSVRAAEYTLRFGPEGEHLNTALAQIDKELASESNRMLSRKQFDEDGRKKWLERQSRDVRHAVGAMEGTLGKDISPAMRKFNSYMTVYQNVRLLPLALFSSFVDPLQIIGRGGEMHEAYDAFLGGMKEVFRAWGNAFRSEPAAKQRTQWDNLAETIGAIDSDIFNHYVSDEYSSGYMASGAKKINDKMFVLNGMEAWNRSMRVGATKAAAAFLVRHKDGESEHSARWLAELGLTANDVHLDADGQLITDRHVLAAAKGISLNQATADIAPIHLALNRWVEGAILTPNAAQRPSWSSDPRYSVIFHLKQFAYSFHQTVMKRAVKELEFGNLAPMGVFAWYIPVMIAADISKGLMVGGGELPAYMKSYNMGDWVMHGVQRAGLLGAGQIGVEAGHDLSSLGGPAIEQMIDAITDPIGKTTIKALPLHGLFQEALKSSATVAGAQ